MDISSIDLFNQSTYSNAVENTKKYDSAVSKDYSNATDDELMDACKKFESYFIEQMFSAMQKMVPESEFTSSSSKMMTDYYKDQLITEYADKASNQNNGNGIGIAQMLYEQMKRNYEI